MSKFNKPTVLEVAIVVVLIAIIATLIHLELNRVNEMILELE